MRFLSGREMDLQKNLNENLETPHVAPRCFLLFIISIFYLKGGILNPSPFLVFIRYDFPSLF